MTAPRISGPDRPATDPAATDPAATDPAETNRPETDHAVDQAVGARIRDLRRAAGLSLATVAGRAGLSIGLISQVERGLSSPTLRVLTAIADVLGVGLAGLFVPDGAAAPGNQIVTREGERAQLRLWRSGISKQLLSPSDGASRLAIFLVHMQPGASSGDELYTHDGEEAGVVVEGEMALIVETDSWILKTGDSFRFSSRRRHRIYNPSAAVAARILWAQTS